MTDAPAQPRAGIRAPSSVRSRFGSSRTTLRCSPAVSFAASLALAACCALSGCASQQIDPRAERAAEVGRFGPVAATLSKSLPTDRSDREYLLSRLRVLQMTLAEGVPQAGEEVANQLFDLLRTQGLNDDRTVASVVLNEGVKIWKGEPFEQALAFHAISLQKAMQGEWDNARAAAANSLFLLKDFSKSVGKDAPPLRIAQRAAELDKASPGAGDELLDHGYVADRTDFALGHLMHTIASRALGRDEEAMDHARAAADVAPGAANLATFLASGDYNTVLVVDFGAGPSKTAGGPDGSIARWLVRTRSDDHPVRVMVEADAHDVARAAQQDTPKHTDSGEFAQVQDVNAMAASHRWNNLEDVRKLKSALGDMLIAGGVIVASSGNAHDNKDDDTRLAVGLAMAGLGALLKATAVADTRYAEFLPQRVYLVPLLLPDSPSTVTLDVEGKAGSRVRLHGLRAPVAGHSSVRPVQLRYVRIPIISSPWQREGDVLYASDGWEQAVSNDTLPYIMGGSCVRTPSPGVLAHYRAGGHLLSMTQVELENLYREEGITWTVEDQQGKMRRHVLEGGTSLIAPLPGSLGFERLFAQPHDPYQPRSDALRRAIEEERAHAGTARRESARTQEETSAAGDAATTAERETP